MLDLFISHFYNLLCIHHARWLISWFPEEIGLWFDLNHKSPKLETFDAKVNQKIYVCTSIQVKEFHVYTWIYNVTKYFFNSFPSPKSFLWNFCASCLHCFLPSLFHVWLEVAVMSDVTVAVVNAYLELIS